MTAAADWRARVGDVWAAEWRRTDRSFAGLTPHLDAAIAAAAPDAGRFLDIGCGAGATTLATARARPGAEVLGVDLSPALIEVAKMRLVRDPLGAGRPDFVAGDVLAVAAERRPFDLLVSRHGVMFFADPHAAVARLRAAGAPGAPLVFSCFRARALNPWADDLVVEVTGARPPDPSGYAPGPFGLADETFVAELLGRAGWTHAVAEPIDFAYVAGEGEDPVADAADYLTRIGPLASAIAAASDPAMLRARLADVLASYCVDDAVQFPAAAWIWRAQAGDPA